MNPEKDFGNPKNPLESIEGLEAIVVEGLTRAGIVHDSLGASGEEIIQKNQFGETALRADVECEKAILDFLRESRIPIRIISEEHGRTDIASNPRYLGIIDGIDGTEVYKKERGVGRYTTMFGIFDTTDPSYKNYLVSGIYEHSSKRLFVAHRGGGAFVVEGGVRTPIHTSGKTRLELDPKTNIYIDEGFDINKKTFSNKLQSWKPTDRDFSSGCAAVHYLDVANGVVDLTLECTRKNNLEIAISYGLITEAGGVMVDLKGEPISDKKYLEFGQKEKLGVVTAATMKLAEDLLVHIKKRDFFARFALSVKSALVLHKRFGKLWEKNAEGERDFGNISEHCLVEGARSSVLADVLKFDDTLKRDLTIAAVLHDYYKKHEIMALRKYKGTNTPVLGKMAAINEEGDKHLRDSGFSEEVIGVTNAAGGYPHVLIMIKEILDKENLTDHDIAKLIMNYVDAYTNNQDWVPVSDPTEKKSAIDVKMDRITKNPNYAKSEAEAKAALKEHPYFHGKASAEGLTMVSRLIEKKLSDLIKERSGIDVPPLELPEFIDNEVRKKILSY